MVNLVTEKTVRDLAHRIFWTWKARAERVQADYDEMVRECREQGYRPHYCIHGTDQWTDYDNICGPCEDSQPLWDDARDWYDAKCRALETMQKVQARADIAEQAFKLDRDNPELGKFMMEWLGEPIDRLKLDKK